MNKKFELEPSNYNKLNCVKLGCDRPLTNRLIKPPFPNQSFFMTVVGKPGSGKSTYMFSLLTTKTKNDRIYYKVFKDIIYVCPSNSRNSIKDNPLEDLETVFNELGENVRDAIIDNKTRYGETPEKNYNQLLIIDDCSSDLKKLQNINMISELSKNRRHLSLSIILLVQYVRDIPRSIRSQNTHIILFKPGNGLDYDILRKEFIQLKTDLFNDLMSFTFKDKHDNLIINLETNELYKNLQKININD